jgi:hypothetical protein
LEAKQKGTKTPEQLAAEKKAADEAAAAGAPPEGDEVPSWAKALVDGFQSLNGKVAAMEGEKTTTTRKQQLSDALKDANPVFRDHALAAFDMIPFKDDESFIAHKNATVQAASNLGLGKDAPGASGVSGNGKEASQAELDSINL